MWPFRKRTTAKDLVCGMEVEPKRAAATSTHNSATYYFCSRACKERFEQEPGKYIGGGMAADGGAGEH